jgi:Ran GTPase-activating protein 1
VLRLEGNTISPEAAEELAKVLVKHPEFERFIGNDIFTGRLKDEIPLSLVRDFLAKKKNVRQIYF